MFYSCSVLLSSAAAGLFVEMKGYTQTHRHTTTLLGKNKNIFAETIQKEWLLKNILSIAYVEAHTKRVDYLIIYYCRVHSES